MPPAVLSGSSATTEVVGPFYPVKGKPVVLELSGTWTGTVAVKRSSDGGSTKVSLTVGGSTWASFTANCCEQVWEESDEKDARLYLDITRSSGTIVYRMS